MDDYQRRDLMAMREAPNYKAYLGQICSNYVTGKNVLEVGAGLGDFASELLKHSPANLTALEPGDECFAELQNMNIPNLLPQKLYSSELLTTQKESFDTLIYSNVLEHIEDDLLELNTAANLLKKGGHVVIIVPAHQYLFCEIDRKLLHFRRYSRSDLVKLTSKVQSLKLVQCHYINKIGAFGWLLNKWRGSTEHSTTLLRIFDRYILPLSKAMDPIGPNTFGLSVVAVARKL